MDPYFSGTKLRWLLENVDGLRERAEAGRALFGTIDSYLIWKLTGGATHATDATNACRTMLYNIHEGRWDAHVCELLGVPQAMLPEIRDCAADYGTTDILGPAIPVLGVAGDQQAATIGQACFGEGMLKSTYGTGCFALLNTGDTPVASSHRLLTTVAYQLDGKATYALEGSIFIAGAVVQWLRDGLGIIGKASDTQPLAEKADPNQRLEAMRADMGGLGETVLRVDGGMSASDWAMQYLADILGAPVDRPEVLETTALGAAWLAGMKAGVCPGPEAFAKDWALERRFEPMMAAEERDARYGGWQDAVRRTLTR
jgi:glycerol kinase